MIRRDNSALLIPLLALVALFYPSVGRRSTPRPGLSGSSAERQNASETRPAASGDDEWKGGRTLVRYFLGSPKGQKDGTWPVDDSRRNTRVEFLIATVPDPVDSGLPHLFDRRLDSIQSALQHVGYLPTGRFRLPWQDCLMAHAKTATGGKEGDPDKPKEKSDTGQSNDDKQKACEQQRPFWKEPGVMLLRDTSPTPDVADGPHLLLLYLIGETPISGIQKRALGTALREMAWFCGWRRDDASETPLKSLGFRLEQQCTDKKIRILGPTFSGSAQSLDFALSSWLSSANHPDDLRVQMISGSATAVDHNSRATAIEPNDSFLNIKTFYRRTPGFFTFSSMNAPDRIRSCVFLNYLKQVEPDLQRGRVALLSEGGTVYGNRDTSNDDSDDTLEPELTCSNDTKVTKIRFPLHISQLRAASEAIRESQQQTSPQIGAASQGLPLSKSLEEVNQPHDTMAPLSPLDPLTAEQVMGQLLSTISRGGYRYVGILATDARDTMFLAQEVREHCPSTVLFAFDPEILFLHPEVNAGLRGMLLVTSYSLFNNNLLWSPPHPSHGKNHVGNHLLTQFPDQGSEGTYNATLALMDHDERLLEYGLPFHSVAQLAPLWITVVGRSRMWPLRVYDLDKTAAQNYMHEFVRGSAAHAVQDAELDAEEKESWFEGVYPTGTLILMAVLTALSLVFSLPLLGRFRAPAGTGNGHEPGHWSGGAWLERALGEGVSETYRRPGELYLLGACSCLGIVFFFALTALLVPVLVMDNLKVSPWRTSDTGHSTLEWLGSIYWGRAAFAALCFVSVAALLAGSVALLAALRPRVKKGPEREQGGPKNESNLPAWGPTVALVGGLVIFAVFLAGSWLQPGRSKEDYYSAFFASLRSIDLLSGVSPLVPLFLIFMAGFLWSLSSFRRLRQLEVFESKRGFLSCTAPLGEIGKLERQVRSNLGSPSLRLPGAVVVVVLAECSVGYLFGFRLLNSFEDRSFHWLLGLAFFAVTLALWCGVLRFYCIWRSLHRLLHHLHLAPMKAYKRFRISCPSAYKIDLASPHPTLASLAYSVEQARTVCLRARRLLEAPRMRLQPAVGDEARWASGEIRTQGQEARWSIAELKNRTESESPAARDLTPEQVLALQRLGSDEMTNLVDNAETYLKVAREADVDDQWRYAVKHQVKAQEVVTQVVERVALALHDAWWDEVRGPSKKSSDSSKSKPEDDAFQLGEDFLVGRIAHFLAYVMPQMQNLIVASVSGLLLMLFAISSYPFQPHNLLLFFNWLVILSFVGIAMWVFIQMSRDPVLSSLNGTKAGKISWDWNFVFRILIYGIVPILALLGAQFPQSVGQIVSHFIPSDAGH